MRERFDAGHPDPRRFDARRWAAWALLAVLAVAMARQASDPRPELAILRLREAQLTQRFNATCAGQAAARLQLPADAEPAAAGDPWDALCMAEELRQVQGRIADLESRWWW